MSERPRFAPVELGVAAGIAVATMLLVLVQTAGWAVKNGDEAIYAEAAREMVAGARFDLLRWQGIPIFSRPPASAWVLTVGHWLFSDERAVRWPLAFLCGLECGLVVLYGARLFRLAIGVVAALLLVGSGQFVGYARYYESEPLLCVCVLIALLGYEHARRDGRALSLYALGLAGALYTKQLIGLLPLGVIFVDAIVRPPDRVPWRRALLAVGAAVLAVGAWYALVIARYGAEFVNVHFVGNIVRRSQGAILHRTTPLYYLTILWKEGLPGVLYLVALVVGVGVALRRRASAPVLLAGWGLGVLVLFSIVSSRYDYYLLLAYPAFALLAAALLVEWLPLRPRLRAVLVVLCVVTGALTTWPERLGNLFGDIEMRQLVTTGVRHSPDAHQLLIVEQLPYSARYYAPPEVALTVLLRNRADYDEALWQQWIGMPTVPEHAPDLDAAIRAHPTALVVVPNALVGLVAATPLTPIARTPTYSLLRWQPRSD